MPPVHPASAGLPRIRRLALAVRLLSLLGAAALLLLPPLFWSQPDWVAEVARQQWGVGAPLRLDATARWAGLAWRLTPARLAIATPSRRR